MKWLRRLRDYFRYTPPPAVPGDPALVARMLEWAEADRRWQFTSADARAQVLTKRERVAGASKRITDSMVLLAMGAPGGWTVERRPGKGRVVLVATRAMQPAPDDDVLADAPGWAA